MAVLLNPKSFPCDPRISVIPVVKIWILRRPVLSEAEVVRQSTNEPGFLFQNYLESLRREESTAGTPRRNGTIAPREGSAAAEARANTSC